MKVLSKYKVCPIIKGRSDGTTSGAFGTETTQVSGKEVKVFASL